MDIDRRRRLLLAAAGLAAPAPFDGARAQAPGPAGAPRAPLPKVGAPLALPELALFDGTTFRPRDAEGKVTVVYWWASWCPFCAIQSPSMQKLWDDARGRGLVFLGLSIDAKIDDARQYLARKGYTFPSGWFTQAVAKVLPQPKGLPVTLVRGRDGKIALAEAGQMFPEDIADIAKLV